MFRNQYDSDVTVWSPQGRLHQVDYAVEAMKQGSATVGIKSETHAVLVALKRAQNELCSHQKKIYEVDTHAGVSIAGLLSDGRILARYLQTECSSWRWDYKQPVPVTALAGNVQLKLQANTQYYGRRPFGVGLLIAGYDKDGAHIVQTDPSAEVVEMFASSIGARSQSARTYLERHLEQYKTANLDQLIMHSLLALRDTLPAEENLTSQNTSIAVVGKGQAFKIMDDAEVGPHLERIKTTPRTTAQVEEAYAPANMPSAIHIDILECIFERVSSNTILVLRTVSKNFKCILEQKWRRLLYPLVTRMRVHVDMSKRFVSVGIILMDRLIFPDWDHNNILRMADHMPVDIVITNRNSNMDIIRYVSQFNICFQQCVLPEEVFDYDITICKMLFESNSRNRNVFIPSTKNIGFVASILEQIPQISVKLELRDRLSVRTAEASRILARVHHRTRLMSIYFTNSPFDAEESLLEVTGVDITDIYVEDVDVRLNSILRIDPDASWQLISEDGERVLYASNLEEELAGMDEDDSEEDIAVAAEAE